MIRLLSCLMKLNIIILFAIEVLNSLLIHD